MAEVFHDREKAFEAQFGHEQDLSFRVRVRRNRMLGLWVAEAIGITGDGAESYARDIVSLDLEKPGDGGILSKILADFQNGGIDMTEPRLKLKMEKMMAVAREKILREG